MSGLCQGLEGCSGFYEDKCGSSSGSAWPACPPKMKSGPQLWVLELEVSSQFA